MINRSYQSNDHTEAWLNGNTNESDTPL